MKGALFFLCWLVLTVGWVSCTVYVPRESYYVATSARDKHVLVEIGRAVQVFGYKDQSSYIDHVFARSTSHGANLPPSPLLSYESESDRRFKFRAVVWRNGLQLFLMENGFTDPKRALEERQRLYLELRKRGVTCELRQDRVNTGKDLLPFAP